MAQSYRFTAGSPGTIISEDAEEDFNFGYSPDCDGDLATVPPTPLPPPEAAQSTKRPRGNTHGRAGTFKCTPCRENHKKCNFDKKLPGQSCDRCETKDIPCDWKSKKNGTPIRVDGIEEPAKSRAARPFWDFDYPAMPLIAVKYPGKSLAQVAQKLKMELLDIEEALKPVHPVLQVQVQPPAVYNTPWSYANIENWNAMYLPASSPYPQMAFYGAGPNDGNVPPNVGSTVDPSLISSPTFPQVTYPHVPTQIDTPRSSALPTCPAPTTLRGSNVVSNAPHCGLPMTGAPPTSDDRFNGFLGPGWG